MKMAAKPKKFSPILVPEIPRLEAKDEVISFRLPGRLKAGIDRQLKALGVPDSRKADFYRGAILAAIGNSLRARDASWQKFLEAIQPLARQHLGLDLMDSGAKGILDEGDEETRLED
jgi:hypothetical protein